MTILLKKWSDTVKKPVTFLVKWRSLPLYELASYVFMFASMPMLAYGITTYTFGQCKIILFTVLTLYCGFFAALIWNDITDVKVDCLVHPDRPLPEGRIVQNKFFLIALLFSALTFIFSSIVGLYCLLFVCFSALFVAIHNKYLKKKINITAFSEIVTPMQWTIVPVFGFLAAGVYDVNIILSLVLFTYFADSAHDISEGIHDAKGDKIDGIKTYAVCLGKRKAKKISFLWFIISGIFGITIYFVANLSPLFLFLFCISWLYTFRWYYTLLTKDEKEIEDYSLVVGRKGFNYFLIVYDAIFIDLIIQLLYYNLV